MTRVLNQEVIEKDMTTILFIQISISEYQRHGTKLCHLSNEAPENPRKSILDHCLTSFNSGNPARALYVYVSPHSTTKNGKTPRQRMSTTSQRKISTCTSSAGIDLIPCFPYLAAFAWPRLRYLHNIMSVQCLILIHSFHNVSY